MRKRSRFPGSISARSTKSESWQRSGPARNTYWHLNTFERIAKPKNMIGVDTRMIDGFRSQRLLEPGVRKGTTISEATVNSELRSLKAVLRKAAEWKYLAAAPKVNMVKERVRFKRSLTGWRFSRLSTKRVTSQRFRLGFRMTRRHGGGLSSCLLSRPGGESGKSFESSGAIST